jgi:hypothetical protein
LGQLEEDRSSVTLEIFGISFCVFVCAFPLEISSTFCKSFPFPYFVLSVLWYFPFHVVYNFFSLFVTLTLFWNLHFFRYILFKYMFHFKYYTH